MKKTKEEQEGEENAISIILPVFLCSVNES